METLGFNGWHLSTAQGTDTIQPAIL